MFNINATLRGFGAISIHEDDALIYMSNRDLIYKGTGAKHVIIPCDSIHAQLKLAENSAHSVFPIGSNTNLATANIGFVVSSHPYDAAGKRHSRRFISVPLHRAVDWTDPNKKHHFTTQIRDLWSKNDTKAVRTVTEKGAIRRMNRNPKQLLRQKRANSYADNSGLNEGTLYDDFDFDKQYASAGPALENQFHHSEQAIFEMLQKKEVIHYYIQHFLQAYNVQPGDKIYAIILDIYTTRYMCPGCAARSHSTVHHPNRALLSRWQWELESLGYHVPKVGLRMAVRATGEQPAQGQGRIVRADYRDAATPWVLNPGQSALHNIVLEADARHIDFTRYRPFNDLFRRTVFISKEEAGINIQDRAIEDFGVFLRRYAARTHTTDNLQYQQAQAAGMPVRAILHTLRPKLRVRVPEAAIARRQLAQNIYLPGQPASLSGAEFRGLYFI